MTIDEFKEKACNDLTKALALLKKNKNISIILEKVRTNETTKEMVEYFGNYTMFFLAVFPGNAGTLGLSSIYWEGGDPIKLPLLTKLMAPALGEQLRYNLSKDDFRVLCLAGGLYACGLEYGYIKDSGETNF